MKSAVRVRRCYLRLTGKQEQASSFSDDAELVFSPSLA